ncbi:MAG: radical SAM protein [Desulfobacterales bacterium]|nr:radical SAM protein [Desulfobacterales bacterium]
MSNTYLIKKFKNRVHLLTKSLIKRKPLFILRALYHFIISEIFNKRPLRGVLFATHYKCNLNCIHCYEKYFHQTQESKLTLEEKKQIIQICLNQGVLNFDFIGGETSISDDFPELVKACQPWKTYISLATNGYNLSEKKIRYFKEIGVDKISISIDSWFEEEHDFLRRKKGAYKNAINTFNTCKKIDMDVHIGMVIYRDYTKTQGFKNMVNFAIKNNISLGMIPAVPLGGWQGQYDKLISERDRKVMDELHLRYPFITSDNYDNRSKGCPAFDEVITITPYGDVLPCDFIHISFGNLKRERLDTIIKKGRSVSFFNTRYKNCLAAENKEFIQNYLSKTYNAYPYPVCSEDVFHELIKS